ALAHLVHDQMRGRTRAPVGELELNDSDGVLGQLAQTSRLLADAGVDSPEARKSEHAPLDLGERAVLLIEREIAAAMHDHLAIVGLDRGKELDATPELAIGHLNRDEQKRRERQRRARMA